jgi:hypothetical protein
MKYTIPPLPDFKLNVVCIKCDTQIELEANDIKYGKFYSGLDCEVSMDYFVNCPVCKELVFINRRKLPKAVAYAAEIRGKGK